MKAHKILVKTVKFKDVEGNEHSQDLSEVVESVILATPPGGSTTEALVKSCLFYTKYTTEKAKSWTSSGWYWYLNEADYAYFAQLVKDMRWGNVTKELKIAIFLFCQEILESKPCDVEIATPEPVPTAAAPKS